jgi:hypothetical protein
MIALLSVGCNVKEEDFAEKYGETYCKKWKSCDKDAFNDVWEEGTQQCVESTEDIIETLFDFSSALGGEYDSGSASRCLADIRSASCDDLDNVMDASNSCDDVMD